MNHQEFVRSEQQARGSENINTDPREQRQRQSMDAEKVYPRKSKRRGLGILLALLLILLLIGGTITVAILQGNFPPTLLNSQQPPQVFTTSGQTKLVINDDSGKVTIHAGNTNQVIIQATKYVRGFSGNLDGMQIQASQTDNTVNVTAKAGASGPFISTKGVDLDITTPQTSDVEVDVASGSVKIDGINGQVAVQTASGGITANHINGQVTLSTQSGSVNASDLNGQIVVTTRSGRINVAQSQLKANSSLKANSGAITFDGSIDPSGSYRFEIDSGSIDVTLPSTSSFRLDASTSSGSLQNDFASTTVGNGPYASLSLSASSGSITLHRK